MAIRSSVKRQSWAAFVQGTFTSSELSVKAGLRMNADTYYQNSYNFSEFAIDTANHSFSDHVPTGRFEMITS